jgi:hypothetical protein
MKRASLAVLAGMILGSFALPAHASWTLHSIISYFPTITDVAASDLDGDGDYDVVAVGTSGSVAWFENLGNQTFVQHSIATNMIGARRVCAGDLDNDGNIDLVVACTQSPAGVVRFMNNGAMQFTAAQLFTSWYFWEMELHDLDQDGDLDLIGSDPGGNLKWWENTQGGQVFVVHTLSYDSGRGFGVSDLDGDGDPDVVGWADFNVVWFENVGPQTFVMHTVAAAGDYGFEDVAAGDLDGDGDLDILAGYEGFKWYANDGNQNFTYADDLPGPGSPSQVHVMDLDGDGCQDVVMTNFMQVYWMENFLCLNFDLWQLSQQGTPGTVHYDMCDMNQDGKMDVVACGTMTTGILWYENQLNPTLKILAAPVNPPIVIPAQGGWFNYNVHLWNTTSDTLQADFWTTAGIEELFARQILLRNDVTFPPDTCIVKHLAQFVSGDAPAGEYYYRVQLGDFPGAYLDGADFTFTKQGVRVWGSGSGEWTNTDEWSQTASLPSGLTLAASPNPFNASTVISYELRAASFVKLEVFDIKGRNVGARLASPLDAGWQEAGTHSITFDGAKLASGVYLARLTAREFTATQKLVLLK